VFDPLSCFRGGDENDAADTTRFVVPMRRLVKETDATILMVHHANKNSARNDDFSQHASRGSSALTDGVRWQAGLFPVPQDKQPQKSGMDFSQAQCRRYAKFAVTKNNYALHQDDMWVTTDDNGILIKATFDPAGKHGNSASGANTLKLVKQEELKGRTYSKSQFAQKFCGRGGPLGLGRDAVLRELERHIDEGRLVEQEPDKATRGVTRVMRSPIDRDAETAAEYSRQSRGD
jgi:RecA-family ATPase